MLELFGWLVTLITKLTMLFASKIRSLKISFELKRTKYGLKLVIELTGRRD